MRAKTGTEEFLLSQPARDWLEDNHPDEYADSFKLYILTEDDAYKEKAEEIFNSLKNSKNFITWQVLVERVHKRFVLMGVNPAGPNASKQFRIDSGQENEWWRVYHDEMGVSRASYSPHNASHS